MKKEFTYIAQWIETPQYCKIGKSINPLTRLQSYLTIFPGTLRVLMICPSELFSEKSLHDEFELLRYSGEHFSYTPDIRARIIQINSSTGFKEYEIDRKIDPFSLLKLKEGRPKYIKQCPRRGLLYRRVFPIKHKGSQKSFARILCKPGEILDRVEFDRRYFKAHAEYEAIENSDKKEFKAHEIWATHAYSIKYVRQIKQGSIVYRRSIPPNLRNTFGKQELSQLLCDSTEVITVDEFFKRYDQAHQQIQSQIEEKS